MYQQPSNSDVELGRSGATKYRVEYVDHILVFYWLQIDARYSAKQPSKIQSDGIPRKLLEMNPFRLLVDKLVHHVSLPMFFSC